MASIFCLEIDIEELKSYIDCKEFYIEIQFADVFSVILKDPNKLNPLLPQIKKIKKSNKIQLKNTSALKKKTQVGQVIHFNRHVTTLITDMKNFPVELSLFDIDDADHKLGTSHIPWSPIFIDYLYAVSANRKVSPVCASSRYNVFEDLTRSRIATIHLNFKLTHMENKTTPLCCILPEPNQNICMSRECTLKPPKTIINTIKKSPPPTTTNYCKIDTIEKAHRTGKRKIKTNGVKLSKHETKETVVIEETKKLRPPSLEIKKEDNLEEKCKITLSKLCLIKSYSSLDKKRNKELFKTKSSSSLNSKHYNYLNYVFGDNSRPWGNRVFCVGYFTVENDFGKDVSSSNKDTNSSKESGKTFNKSDPEKDSQPESMNRYKFKLCENSCSSKKSDNSFTSSMCSFDLPKEAADNITITKCKEQRCDEKTRKVPLPPDDSIRLNTASLLKDCCTREEIVGGMQANMKYDESGCMCTCECTFGFVKRTTYCGICGGYEGVGEDMPKKHADAPFPCPIYHKLVDKNKKPPSTSESDRSKVRCDDSSKSPKKGSKSPASGKSVSGKLSNQATDAESNKDVASKKKKKDDRFKFNYGYTAPQIGHSKCAMPCTGTLGAVPKNMGWLWTAEDIPGMKFRPMWKPGATHKQVVRLLRMAKDPGIVLAKKKKKEVGKKKRPLKRPLLTVAKKDGEYTVTMETMKIYPKQRALNQHPYEDKPVVTYTIGRTEEENRERKKRKEREQRRLERDQREFIQSAFSDMCKEICLKTYQQALGLLPDAEDPDCACYPKLPGVEDTNLNRSCSCSDDEVSFGSDTDSDEWIVEFTPPNATFDPTYKGKKLMKSDNSTQYSYLDYRVKLLDRFGNQVPRFFKGPDGKTQCSDLGGFWSPDHKWLEINIDGYIGPDGKWAPIFFRGPNGEQVDCDSGKFQASNGSWLVVGVDGYIDASGNWKFYSNSKCRDITKNHHENVKKATGDKKDDKGMPYKSEATWSCFGDVDPKDLSKLGILGHGQDKRLLLKTLKNMLDRGVNVKIPEPSSVPRLPGTKKTKRKGGKFGFTTMDSQTYLTGRRRCKHPVPSEKGVLAVDDQGNKTYFKLKDYRNKRPHQRLAHLTHQGISLSSFHVPCLSSFIDAETMKRQQYERFLKNDTSKNHEENKKNAATQYRYRYIV